MKTDNVISLVYIDDERDEAISAYLENEYRNEECEIKYSEIEFNEDSGYDSLLKNSTITSANVIIIDSRLFENNSLKNNVKFSGEEFRVLLLTKLPFIEVLVISQNGENESLGVIPKYRHGDDNESAISFYARVLRPKIDESVAKVIIYKNILSKLEKNKGIDRDLINRTRDSFNGIDDYKNMTKDDVDKLIAAFKEV